MDAESGDKVEALPIAHLRFKIFNLQSETYHLKWFVYDQS